MHYLSYLSAARYDSRNEGSSLTLRSLIAAGVEATSNQYHVILSLSEHLDLRPPSTLATTCWRPTKSPLLFIPLTPFLSFTYIVANMARRIVRTIVQLILLSVTFVTVLFFLDVRYSLLPTQIHNLLPEHHAGQVITDITYESCPRIGLLSCAAKEGWVRIEKDLFLGKTWWTRGYIQFKRTKEEELNGEKFIVDVRVRRSEPAASEGGGDAKWESRPGGIWIKRSPKVIDDAVTGVDVLFGPDAAEVRPGWVLREGSLTVGESPRITVRKGAPPAGPKKPVLKFRNDHKFKIIQISGAAQQIPKRYLVLT